MISEERLDRIAQAWCRRENEIADPLNMAQARFFFIRAIRQAMRNGWNDEDYIVDREKYLGLPPWNV